MTYPDVPFPGLPPEQEALFAAAAATYARYRPGVPDGAVHLLADILRDRSTPVLLDLGTGTGQVPLALRSAVPALAHIEAVDVSPQMLDQARDALVPVLGRCTLTLVHAVADAYAPLAPLPGEEVRAPDLVTCCRSYHWMDGPGVLAMADRVAAPDAAVAIMGDGSLWTHDADWTRALRELIQHYLGSKRRAGPTTPPPSPAARTRRTSPRRRGATSPSTASPWPAPGRRSVCSATWAPPPSRARSFLASGTRCSRKRLGHCFTRSHPTAPWWSIPCSRSCSPSALSVHREWRGAAHRAVGRPSDPTQGDQRGAEVLLSRRAGQVYAAGLWHAPSGHLDGSHEDAVTALVREAREETGVVIDPAEVRFAVTVHHRAPGGGARVGMFFEVRAWQGTPRVLEPAVCDAMDWFPLDALPAPMVAYCRAGLDAYRAASRWPCISRTPATRFSTSLKRTGTALFRLPSPGRSARTPGSVSSHQAHE